MRIWDVEPATLCRSHLLGEHRELHAVWTILTEGKRGYANHPEVLRWRGKLAALYARHDAQVAEMETRGYRHASPLDARLATGAKEQDDQLASTAEQLALLAGKPCECRVEPGAQPR
ncbi:MAG: pyrimidine dimer DNA glycosylase/endonuclease V [Solirubrobacteraceae bacterium]